MNLNRDLSSPGIIYFKAGLFVVLGILSAGMILVQMPTVTTGALLLISIWAFCRFYYCLFYVLDRYLGREKRYAGIIDALRYILSTKPSRDKS